MATYHTFAGTLKWAQIRRPNKFGVYSVNLYVDKETRSAIKATGFRGRINEDDDGFYYSFRRPHEKTFKNGAEVLGPPEVTVNGKEFDGLIGNGSTAELTVEIYDFPAGIGPDGKPYTAGKGSRLMKIDVKDLIEYKKDEAPVANSAVPAKTSPKLTPDEIPF